MLKLKLFFSLIILCVGCLTLQSAKAQTNFSGVEFSSPTLDMVQGAGGQQEPVYKISSGDKLTISFNYNLSANSSGYIKLNRISDAPFFCSTNAVLGGTALNPQNNCSVTWNNIPESVNLTGKFILYPKAVSLGGDFELSLEASGINNFDSKLFVLRLENLNRYIQSPSDCSVANPGHAVFMPVGGRGLALVDVAVPYTLYKNNSISLTSVNTPESIFISTQTITNSTGVGLVLPISVSADIAPGTYALNLESKLSITSNTVGHCALFVVVEPILADAVIDPSSVNLEVNQTVPIQILAKSQDGQTVDVSNSNAVQITNPNFAKFYKGKLTGVQAGEGDVSISVPDPWSNSGKFIEKKIHIVVSQPKDFKLSLPLDSVSRGGGVVLLPLRVDCLSGFDGDISDFKIDTSSFGQSVAAKIIDRQGNLISTIHGCNGDYFVQLNINSVASPLSDDPPFDKPILLQVSARGQNLITNFGFGNGIRATATQLVVLRSPELEANLDSPINVLGVSKLKWTTKYANKCFITGDTTANGEVSVSNQDGLSIGPIKDPGYYKVVLTCVSAFGGEVSKKMVINVEDRAVTQSSENLLSGASIDNNICRQITVTWPSQPGALSYNLYRDSNSNGKTKQIIASSTQTTTYKDSNLLEVSPKYYWLDIVTSKDITQKYLGGTGVRSCNPDMSLSDMEVSQVDYTDLQTVPIPCNGISERLQNFEIPTVNNPFTLRINLCNSGQGDFTPTSLKLDLSNLKLNSQAGQIVLTTLDSKGKQYTQNLSSSDYQITESNAQTSLVFTKLPVIYSLNTPISTQTILIRLAPVLPSPTTLSAYQFTAKADLLGTYLDQNKQTKSISQSFSLPLYQFYSSGKSPKKSEK